MTGIFESTLCPLVNPLLGLLVTSFFSVCCSGLLVRYPIIRPRTFAAVMSIIILIFGLLAVGSLDKNLAGFQFYFAINLSVLAPSMSFGLDGFSGIFVLLTVFIVPLCLLSV
jgi:NADH:ubiquinone oxidoreductase subunit 4 (subunit M)